MAISQETAVALQEIKLGEQADQFTMLDWLGVEEWKANPHLYERADGMIEWR